MNLENRIVVTGMGCITPLGHDLETLWSNLIAGRCGIAQIDRFDAGTFPSTFAAQVREYDFRRYVADPAMHEHAGFNSQFALGAARQAWVQAKLGELDGMDRSRVGVYLGAGEGMLDFDNYARTDIESWDDAAGAIDSTRWTEAAKRRLDAWGEIEQEPNMPASHIAREYGIRGPVYNCLTACAASTQAIGEASDILRRGDAEVMVAGGTHTMIHVLGLTGFNRLTALSTRNDDIKTSSRPFSRSRDGFVLGEGSGIVILETLDHALSRGARPLAEITGYGSSADAFRITDMHPAARGPAEAMLQALAQAGIDPRALDKSGRPLVHYISAHGTSTVENDAMETLAIKAVFRENATKIPVSSIKSMLGHLIAAAGAVEFIACVLALHHQIIPPTTNLTDPEPELDLDYVPNEARPIELDTCLSNSFGFGGQNDTLIIRSYRR